MGAPRFANLESAHQNSKFAQTKFNPFAALGGIFWRHSRLWELFVRTKSCPF